MAKRLKIGVDMDGVIDDFTSAFRNEAEVLLGRKINGVQTNWNFEDCLDITKDEVKRVWDKIFATENWWYLTPEANPLVDELLPWLCKNHDVYFITNRPEIAGFPTQQQTAMYLDELDIQFPTVLVVKNKGPIVKALALDVFLDDRPENLENIRAYSPTTYVRLMDQPYNRDYQVSQLSPDYTPIYGRRVFSFQGFITDIEELSNES